jgi:hypothetical protein
MNEAFKELADAGQPMYMQQKVQLLLRSIKCDDIQVQTTMGIIRDRYLNDFDAACLTLSRTVSSRFASIEPGKNKRSIGATTTNTRNTRGSGGRGRGRSGGRGNQNGGRIKVMMNGVDVSDIHRNFTSDEWDKLRMVGGHTYIYQRLNAVTAFTDESNGETVILNFNQVLWYGKRMKMSLINPNQLRHFGITVSDDPTDTTRPFGISTGEGLFVPFRMEGTTVYFETRVPTGWELENSKSIQVTDSTVWNPSNVTIAGVSSDPDLPMMEIATRRSLFALRATNTDTSEESCNDLAPYDELTLLSRMIGKVNVATAHRDVNVSFVGSKERHSQVNAETVARKFRCGLETAQRTLKTTTQRGVRQSIHPLHRRYRVDHLNLHRRRLNDTFYMDTLFSKIKSLNGHTCAQLITNGTFTRIYPMESKSSHNIAQALNEFVDDVGIPGTLICDLASEQTGKNTEVLKAVRRFHIRLLPAEK